MSEELLYENTLRDYIFGVKIEAEPGLDEEILRATVRRCVRVAIGLMREECKTPAPVRFGRVQVL